MLTDRQEKILSTIADEYTRHAEPVSSQFLEDVCDFGIRGAMIRREMQELTNQGFLEQPHTSAGRAPTDKGYRFLVDKFLEGKSRGAEQKLAAIALDIALAEIENTTALVHSLTKAVSEASSALALSYIDSLDFIWKEGWEGILRQPEFQEDGFLDRFLGLLEKLESRIEKFDKLPYLQIYIGQENPFLRVNDFSTIILRCSLPDNENGILALVGPRRMHYERNIGILESISRALDIYERPSAQRR